MKKLPLRRLVILLLMVQWSIVEAQDIFPTLTDQELIDALVDAYKTSTVLSLAQAKDTLYAVIDNEQDSVHGIYSDFTLHLPSGTDPSQWVFMDGNGINLEHSWPRSKGATEGTPGHSDMHHLFPTRVAVNSARASNPFAEIPNNNTTTWFYRDIAQSSLPTINIDAYSESISDAFEPREEVKGNIARAAFYFYSMYQSEADAADPDFFAAQRATLLTWHAEDPVDEQEVERSATIAVYQDGKENPYVLDPTLAERAFCGDPPCMTTSTRFTNDLKTDLAHYIEGCTLHIETTLLSDGVLDLALTSAQGHVLRILKSVPVNVSNPVAIDLRGLPFGIYVLTARLVRGAKVALSSFKIAYIR